MSTPRRSAFRHAGLRWLLPLLLCLGATQAFAQTAPQDDDAAGDPPDRVARLSYLAGDVALQPAGTQDWSDAALNRPLTNGDQLSTQPDARAELELDGATIHIDGGTDLGVLGLNNQLAQFQLTRGTLELSVRTLAQGESYEIDTPTVALVVDQPGTFRVDVDGAATIRALDGNAVVFGENNTQRDILAGRMYRFEDASLSRLALMELPDPDGFDQWSASRDHRYDDGDAAQYADAGMVGYQDLDQYGNWQDDADYGEVWYPSAVAADWAPYRDGRWSFVAPWGWTWVDDLPWGFAPYHYGRWVYRPRGWCWVPGPRGVRPVYAPALVAFVGGGIGGAGPVGWFPLGPGEIYNPWYRASRGYYQRVNVSNLRWRPGERAGALARIDDHYRAFRGGSVSDAHYINRNAPRGFTAVAGASFAGSQRVQHHLLGNDARQLAAMPVIAHGNGLPAGRRAVAAAPQAGGFRREVVTHNAPVFRGAMAPRQPSPSRAEPFPAATRNDAASLRSQPRPMTDRMPGRDAGMPRDALPSSRFAPHYAPGGNQPPPRNSETLRASERPAPDFQGENRNASGAAEANRWRGQANLPVPPHFEHAPQPQPRTSDEGFRAAPPRFERAPQPEMPRETSRGFQPSLPMPAYNPPAAPHAEPGIRAHDGGNNGHGGNGNHPHGQSQQGDNRH